MARWDDSSSSVITDLVDEAIEMDDIQVALRSATSDDPKGYAAVATSLRENANVNKFLIAVPEEASAYAETIQIGLKELRSYLVATYDEYRVICDLETDATNFSRQKDLELDQLKAKMLQAKAWERTQGQTTHRSSRFRRRTVAASEELGNRYYDGVQELTGLRRRAADIATDRRKFERTFENRDPEQRARVEKAWRMRNALAEALLEPVILPYLRSAIAKYVALADDEAEDAKLAAAASSPSPEKLNAQERIDMAEENDLPSQLEEVALARSAGVQGPGDMRSVFLVHGRDRRAAKAMREFLRSLDLQVIEWEHAIGLTGQATPYVGDVVLAGMRLADAVVVMSTPDDLVWLRSDLLNEEDPAHEKQILGQARPNVIYEAGIADALDRTRTVLVEVGSVKSLSDLGGRAVVRFDGKAGSRHKLVNRLRKAGLQVNITGEDWLDTGDFNPSIDAARMSLAAALRPEVPKS
jgi:predicted nucleotide-binding protein